MRALVLDAEPLNLLAQETRRGSRRARDVRDAVAAARRLELPVIVTSVTLAELLRSPGRNASVQALLSRERGWRIRDTDVTLARQVGAVLAAANAGSECMADAYPDAAAVEAGGGVVLTSDASDLERLAAAFASVTISAV